MLGISIKILAEQIQKIVEDLNSDGIDAESFNMYIRRLYTAADAYIKYSKEFLKKIDDAEAKFKEKEKEKAAVKESAEVDPEILAVYEACHNGTITEDQREDLIDSIKAKRAASIAIEEAVSDEDNSLKEKYTEVRRLVYEKCANGEFSEAVREDILKAAYNKIFNVEESDDAASQPIDSAKEEADNKKDLDDMNKKIEKAAQAAQ